MKRQIYIVVLFLLGAVSELISQDSIAGLVAIKSVRKEKIILRWAPTTAGAWHNGIAFGYKIERRANKSNTEEWNDFEVLESVVLPWPLARWQKDSISTYDDYCLIAAELMHGKKKESTKSDKILKQADDYRNRYVYAMMAADFSAQAAESLGLRYEDTKIKPGYTYIYRISPLVPNDIYVVNSATVLAYSDQLDELTPPSIHHIESGDRVLHIFWEKNRFQEEHYPAYYIEVTQDGNTYTRLNKKPFISDNPFGSKFDEYHIYTDSIYENYKPIGYRLIGVSPFGDLSLAGATVYSYGRDLTPPSTPEEVTSVQLANNDMQINWHYSEEEARSLKGFLVGRSRKVQDSFQLISSKMLPPESRTFVDTFPDEFHSNYYIISAIDTAGNYAISSSHYAHMIDSIPPSAPTGLTARSSTSGEVVLSWKPNLEKDLLGYTLHYSNHPDHEFAAITNKPIHDTTFRDTVMIKTLTEHLYYKIVAIDKNYNYSDFSPVLMVSIPDIVPPSAAVVYKADVEGDGVKISWIKSSSADADHHILYRKNSENSEWIPIYKSETETTYIDSLQQEGAVYFYKIHAYDEVNNESSDAPIISVMMPPKDRKLNDIHLKATKVNDKIILTWLGRSYDKQYTLYKSNNTGKFTTVARTEQTRFELPFENKDVEFAIRITNQKGRVSDFSEAVKIEMD